MTEPEFKPNPVEGERLIKLFYRPTAVPNWRVRAALTELRSLEKSRSLSPSLSLLVAARLEFAISLLAEHMDEVCKELGVTDEAA